MNLNYRAQSLAYWIQNWITPKLTRPSANRCMSVVVWLIGAWATKVFFIELGMEAERTAPIFALVFQLLLTLAEGPIWHPILRNHKTRMLLGIGAVVVDTALNAGGVWVYLQNLGNTTFWAAISSAMKYNGPPSASTILALSFLLGLAIAAGAEALYDS